MLPLRSVRDRRLDTGAAEKFHTCDDERYSEAAGRARAGGGGAVAGGRG